MHPGAGRTRAPAVGLALALAVLVAAFLVPVVTGWDVDARSDMLGAPPTHGFWQAKVGLGTVPALLVAGVGVARAEAWALRWSWRRLLAVSYVVALVWMLSLALVDGTSGLTRVMTNHHEYLITARGIDEVPAML